MLELLPLKALESNYIWTVHDGRAAVVVDPGDSGVVTRWLTENKLHLEAILCTHHHRDHTAGIPDLCEHYHPKVFGSDTARMAQWVTHPLVEGDTISLLEGQIGMMVWETPGHTADHISFVSNTEPVWLFCGDTLFSCGCGRLYADTAPDLYLALNRYGQLPNDTLLCCGHEYTVDNQAFALTQMPDNLALQQRSQVDQAQALRGVPTLPCTLGLEKQTNPFLMAVMANEPIETLAALRRRKDAYVQ